MKSSESDFIAECEEILEEAGDLLLKIRDSFETGLDPENVNALFRSMHTLKGLAGLFGRQDVSEVSHSLESLLDDIRLGRCDMTEQAVGFFQKFNDTLGNLIKAPVHDSPGHDAYVSEIEAFRDSLKAGCQEEGPAGQIDEYILKVLSEYEEHRLKTNIKDGNGIYMIKPVFGFEDFDVALNVLITEIKAHGELISTMPTTENVPDGNIGFNLMFGSPEAADALTGSLGHATEILLASQKAIAAEAPPLPVDPVEAVVESLKTASTMVRVDITKLDRILNTISELSMARHAVRRIWIEMTDLYGHSPLVVDIYKINQTLDRRLEELQGQVLEIRLVPVGQIYRRLSQVIRRYSHEVGKKIDLKMFGDDTEIDKYLAEEIIDPLVHIVRNAIDHGLEPAEERAAAGKDEVGVVTLKAYQRGSHVVLEVGDDGRGIDTGKIRQKALQKGLIEKGEDLRERDLTEMLFMPGFSTKDTVSEVSGRGVGLDIVKESVSSKGGFVDVSSVLGQGTTFTLTMPITQAILKVLMVRVGKEAFAVPLSSVSETLAFKHAELQSIEGRKVFNLRGDMLPVASIKDVFNIDGDPDTDRSFAVIVGFGDRRMGFLVDELQGQNEIVVKSLSDYFEGIKGLSGAAEVGRHEVVLVIDVEGLIDECSSVASEVPDNV